MSIDINRIGIVGAGQMGSGIAQVCAVAGLDVLLNDRDADRITEILVKLYGEEPEELFRGDPAVEAECPRCGTKHEISRAMFDGAAGAKS